MKNLTLLVTALLTLTALCLTALLAPALLVTALIVTALLTALTCALYLTALLVHELYCRWRNHRAVRHARLLIMYNPMAPLTAAAPLLSKSRLMATYERLTRG